MKRSIMSAAVLALAGILSGCGGAKSGGAAAPGQSGKKDLTIAMTSYLTTLDPLGSSAVQDQIIYRMMYARLYATDGNMQPYPELAESYRKVSDNEYVFTIKKGATFSDGTEITAEDVAYSLERAHQSSVFSTLMATVDTITATDGYTVTVRTNGPSPALLQAVAHPGTCILPKAYLEKAEESKDFSAPVTSGRYLLDKRVDGVSTRLVRNPAYFDPEDAAQNDSLTFVGVVENSARTIQVQTGEADLSTAFSTTDYATVQGDSGVRLYEKPGTAVQYIGMDVTRAPFDNEKVRQAVAYAVDRDGVKQVITEGLATTTYTVIPASTLGYREPNPAGFSYNEARARELLAEAGYPDGFSTTIVVFSDTAQRIAEVAQGYFAAVGITADIKRYDVSVRMNMFGGHQCPVFSASWGALADAELVLPRLFSAGAPYNWSFYDDPQVNALLQRARETEVSAERAELYAEAVSIIDGAAPWVPLYVLNSYALANAGLQGVELDGEGVINLHKLHY